MYGYELTQGNLRVIVEFIPNPYIASVHQYTQNVDMNVIFKNLGGEIQIKNFNVTPQNTVVRTIDNEKQMELIEEVGTEVISCRDLSEIVPDILPTGAEIGGKLCELKPPSIVKSTLKDLENNEVKEESSVAYSSLPSYCTGTESSGTETTSWKNIYNAIGQSGMCEILNEKDSKDKPTIENAMAHVNVLVEFEYERQYPYPSDEITPYTRTKECCAICEECCPK
jgi:hypothetical protein